MFAISVVRSRPHAPPRRRRRRTTGARRSPGSARSRRPDARAAAPRATRALSVCRATRTSSVSSPRRRSHAMSAPGTAPVRAELAQPLGRRPRPWQTTAPTSASSWPARYFVAECSARSQPSSSGLTCSGVAAVESQSSEPAMRGGRLEVRHRQERVRRRLEPDEVRVRRAVLRSGRTRRGEDPSERARRGSRPFRSTRLRRARSSVRARAARAPRRSRPPCRTRTAPRARRRARRAGARPRRRSGWSSASSRTRPARRPRTATSSSGRAASSPADATAITAAWRGDAWDRDRGRGAGAAAVRGGARPADRGLQSPR